MSPPQPQDDELDEILRTYSDIVIRLFDNTINGNFDGVTLPDGKSLRTALLAWRNTYAKAYAKKVGLQAIGEDDRAEQLASERGQSVKPKNKGNFLIEVTPEIMDELNRMYMHSDVEPVAELHYSPYWGRLTEVTQTQEEKNGERQ